MQGSGLRRRSVVLVAGASGAVFLVGFPVDRVRVFGLDLTGVLEWIAALVDAFGEAAKRPFRHLESFRFTAAGLVDRALSFAPFSFAVVLFEHGRRIATQSGVWGKRQSRPSTRN